MQVLEFFLAVLLLTFQLALVAGTTIGLFLLACFAVGWLVEAIRRMR